MHIGFFDSGIGGLSVLKEALRAMPSESYLYYADTLHVPYGPKPREEVKGYVFEAVDFLVRQGIKALVIACNTATIVAVNDLRKKYDFPIIGMEPAVKPAVEKNRRNHKRVLVLATELALKGEKYRSLVAKVAGRSIVDSLPLPELVELAESFEFDESVVLPCLEKKLSGFDLEQYGTVVLGCTHFPLFKEHFEKILPPHIDIIDGSLGTVRRLKNLLLENNLLENGGTAENVTFYASGTLEADSEKLRKIKAFLK